MTSSVAQPIQYRIIWWQWEVAVATINTLYQHLPDKNHRHFNQNRRCPSPYSKWTPTKYKW